MVMETMVMETMVMETMVMETMVMETMVMETMVMETVSLNQSQSLEMGVVAMVNEEKKAAKVTAKRLQFYPLFAFFFLHQSSFNCHGLTQSKNNILLSFLKD
jgi:hypothetical protein